MDLDESQRAPDFSPHSVSQSFLKQSTRLSTSGQGNTCITSPHPTLVLQLAVRSPTTLRKGSSPPAPFPSLWHLKIQFAVHGLIVPLVHMVFAQILCGSFPYGPHAHILLKLAFCPVLFMFAESIACVLQQREKLRVFPSSPCVAILLGRAGMREPPRLVHSTGLFSVC